MSDTSAVHYYGVGYVPVDYLEKTFFSSQVSSPGTTQTFTNGRQGQLAVVDQIEITVTGPSPSQWSCALDDVINGHVVFFYDSQSIGEGLGIRFVWRGRKPLWNGWGIRVNIAAISGGSTASIGIEMRGYWKPAVDQFD